MVSDKSKAYIIPPGDHESWRNSVRWQEIIRQADKRHRHNRRILFFVKVLTWLAFGVVVATFLVPNWWR